MTRRYLDNAATSFPKPPGVVEAIVDYMTNNGSSAGRGAYREAIESGRMLMQCRDAVRRLLHAGPRDHVLFALNGTDALNLVLKSVLRSGDHVVTTNFDHNSVLRPLSALREQRGVAWAAVAPSRPDGPIESADISAAFTAKTKLVVINHASNVTGLIQPVAQLAAEAKRCGALVLLDAAQTAGHVPIDFGALPIDFLAAPGHKGMLGPPGTGVVLVRAGAEAGMDTVREGGTGSESELPAQPEKLPDRFESGSQNAIGIAGLFASLNWILERGIDQLRAHERGLIVRMLAHLADLPSIELYGPRDADARVGVFSLRMRGFEPAELSAILEEQFGLLTRSGLHCAPLAHRTLGTTEGGGLTRFSFGPFTTESDVDAIRDALAQLSS